MFCAKFEAQSNLSTLNISYVILRYFLRTLILSIIPLLWKLEVWTVTFIWFKISSFLQKFTRNWIIFWLGTSFAYWPMLTSNIYYHRYKINVKSRTKYLITLILYDSLPMIHSFLKYSTLVYIVYLIFSLTCKKLNIPVLQYLMLRVVF